ncbi:MAG: hypothetical protein NVS3B28_26790 [Candidatus Velthaea sp.]
MNIHGSQPSPGYNNFPLMLSMVQGLGVKRLRDGVILGQTTWCQQQQQLGAAGFKMTYQTNLTMTPADFDAWATCAGSAMDTMEGPNEWDVFHPSWDSNWVAEIQQFQQLMYRAVRLSSNPAFANVAVIGPSFSSSAAYQAVGDLSNSEDYGNMHNYFAGRNPGTPGWGGGGYGSIPWNLNNSRPASLSRPIVTTETGWGISEVPNGGNYIHEWTAAQYITRLYFENYMAGVPQTYLYELYDEPADISFSNYGLIRGDGSNEPHWSYYALKNLLGLLRDPYAPSSNVSLSYALTGETDNIHHLLMAKADGSVWMALWQEAQDVDPDSNAYTYPPAQTVTLALQNIPKTADVYPSMMSIGAPQSTPADATAPITLSIGADVTLVRLGY